MDLKYHDFRKRYKHWEEYEKEKKAQMDKDSRGLKSPGNQFPTPPSVNRNFKP